MSLAHLWRGGELGKMEFLHVPGGREKADIDKGVRVVMALIAALTDEVDRLEGYSTSTANATI